MITPRHRTAWRAWRSGDVDEAARLARPHRGAERLLVLADLVRGRFEQGLARYQALRRPPRALDMPVAHAWVHLDRVDKACEHLCRRRRRLPPGLALRRDHPMTVKVHGPVTLPFADHPLAPYLPALEGTLNGRHALIHLDTGGAFLVMGLERAAAMGVEAVPAGRRFHGVTRTPVRTGLVRELDLGGVALTNVPVDVLPTLTGPQDIVIMGTCLLRHFLPTIDVPAGHLLLAPRGHHPPPDGVRVPFCLWADHFMFAKGGHGPRDLTFFVDSGLVHLIEDDGRIRQAAVLATRSQYRTWGIPRADLAATHLTAPHPLRLGPLEQTAHLLSVAPGRTAPWSDFGGVRIDGLISQAFLSEYAWTLDFDRQEYTFQ
ncbi:retropepsin-like aspartic protease [Nonomuraea turcica]|uniref:retropepsin-like aspartic protease n=1 Tax=Nonomuraea sp. G32 TaxID=3067274 RepID=UPI00273CB416|nr:retropepsin-like aspartic protease [Nonomuraea sp. G32]MDP4503414.1 retropepsin-like aspartic protease [Nonomuraea sp. G32]